MDFKQQIIICYNLFVIIKFVVTGKLFLSFSIQQYVTSIFHFAKDWRFFFRKWIFQAFYFIIIFTRFSLQFDAIMNLLCIQCKKSCMMLKRKGKAINLSLKILLILILYLLFTQNVRLKCSEPPKKSHIRIDSQSAWWSWNEKDEKTIKFYFQPEILHTIKKNRESKAKKKKHTGESYSIKWNTNSEKKKWKKRI